VLNYIHQKVENLGFHRYQARCAMELATVCIQSTIFEQIEQLATPGCCYALTLAQSERRKNEGNAKGQLRRSESSRGVILVFSRHWRRRWEAMFAPNQTKADSSIGRVLKDLGGAFLEQLVFIGDQLGICIVVRCLQDEARHHATMRQLNRLNDYCLDDI